MRLHRHDENIGALGNFQYVLAQAETEYFTWQAVDDWLSVDYLASLCAILDSAPACALACATTIRVTAEGAPKPGKPPRPFPDLTGQSRRRRIFTLLGRREAEWVYGLFRTERLRAVQQTASAFGHVWSADRLMLLPLVLDDAIRGSAEACLHSRTMGASGLIYAPSTLLGWLRFASRFLAFAMDIFNRSALSATDKLALFPYFFWRMARLSQGGFFKYYVKRLWRRSSPG